MNGKNLIALILIATPLSVTAEVERSVDKQGNTTFSDKPVAGSVTSEKISIDTPAPTPSSVNESQQRSQAVIDKARRSQQQRDSTGQYEAQKRKASDQRIEEARKQLNKSKIVGEGDRQGNARGGTRLSPEYQERVKAAETNLKQAQDAAK